MLNFSYVIWQKKKKKRWWLSAHFYPDIWIKGKKMMPQWNKLMVGTCLLPKVRKSMQKRDSMNVLTLAECPILLGSRKSLSYNTEFCEARLSCFLCSLFFFFILFLFHILEPYLEMHLSLLMYRKFIGNRKFINISFLWFFFWYLLLMIF